MSDAPRSCRRPTVEEPDIDHSVVNNVRDRCRTERNEVRPSLVSQLGHTTDAEYAEGSYAQPGGKPDSGAGRGSLSSDFGRGDPKNRDERSYGQSSVIRAHGSLP